MELTQGAKWALGSDSGRLIQHHQSPSLQGKTFSRKKNLRINEVLVAVFPVTFHSKIILIPSTSIFDAWPNLFLVHFILVIFSHGPLYFKHKCQNPASSKRAPPSSMVLFKVSFGLPVGGLPLSQSSQAYFSCCRKAALSLYPLLKSTKIGHDAMDSVTFYDNMKAGPIFVCLI